MTEMIKGEMFDKILAAVNGITEANINEEGVTIFSKPGLALRLGHNLCKIASIKYGMALRSGDNKDLADSDTFRKLYDGEWTDRVSSRALTSMKV